MLSGVIEVNHGLFDDLILGGVYSEGSVTVSPNPLQIHATEEMRKALGMPEKEVFDEEELVRLAEIDGAVSELMLLWERGDSWANLYKILEHIEHNLGQDVDELGWISSDDRKNFRRTANDRRTIGLDARHGSPEGRSSPTQPMAHSDARSLIRTASMEWLELIRNSDE